MYLNIITCQPGPNAAREKFNAIFLHQSFFNIDLFRFWTLSNSRDRGSDWWGQTCVKNLSWVGVEVCTKFGGDWVGGLRVKEGYMYLLRYKQSVLHIEDKFLQAENWETGAQSLRSGQNLWPRGLPLLNISLGWLSQSGLIVVQILD